MAYTWPFWFNLLFREQGRKSHTQILSAMIEFRSLKLGHDDRMEAMGCWRVQKHLNDLGMVILKSVFCKSSQRSQGGRMERTWGQGELTTEPWSRLCHCRLLVFYLASSSSLWDSGVKLDDIWERSVHSPKLFIYWAYIYWVPTLFNMRKTMANIILTLINLSVGQILTK